MRHPGTARDHHKKARNFLSRHGYKLGGAVDDDDREDRKIAASAVHKHERHMHKGERETKFKLKSGGVADGAKAKPRLDKLARGGRAKGRHHTQVNVMVMPGEQKQPVPVPVPVGARPPMPQGAPQAAPQMPPRPPGMMKRGGRAKPPKLTAGSGNGEGRLQKIKAYGEGPKGR